MDSVTERNKKDIDRFSYNPADGYKYTPKRPMESSIFENLASIGTANHASYRPKANSFNSGIPISSTT
jgi:hypothetical protein